MRFSFLPQCRTMTSLGAQFRRCLFGAPRLPSLRRVSLSLDRCWLDVRAVPALCVSVGGPAGSAWSDPLNWQGFAVPGQHDTAVFDGGVAQADSVLDAGFIASIDQLEMVNGFAGTIQVEKDFTVAVQTTQQSGTI